MLCLSRKPGQKVRIGPDITITVLAVRGDLIRLGIDAPKDVKIVRDDAKDKEPRDGT